MSEREFKPKLYVLNGCPYSCKFLIFAAEAGLSSRFDIVRCDPEDAGFEALKARLAAALGESVEFPVVEIAPARYMKDSDRLIQHYARQLAVELDGLVALPFYRETILPQLQQLHSHQAH